MERLHSFAETLVFSPQPRPLTEDELISMLDGCDGCIAGLDPYSRRVIESAGSLKVISRYGTGIDNIDTAAAKENNVIVCRTPGVNAKAVAELAFGLTLCIARQIPLLDKKTRDNKWERSVGMELYGKTFGIIGLGAVGKEAARIASGFSMKVIACDPVFDSEYAQTYKISRVSFDNLISEADIISLHLPMTEENRMIISAEVMGRMKKGAVIINTARGGLLDESAAYKMLKSGRLGGLGLDVYEKEPVNNSPLFELENVVFTPHTAAHTSEAAAGMAELSVQNLINALSGKEYFI